MPFAFTWPRLALMLQCASIDSSKATEDAQVGFAEDNALQNPFLCLPLSAVWCFKNSSMHFWGLPDQLKQGGMRWAEKGEERKTYSLVEVSWLLLPFPAVWSNRPLLCLVPCLLLEAKGTKRWGSSTRFLLGWDSNKQVKQSYVGNRYFVCPISWVLSVRK